MCNVPSIATSWNELSDDLWGLMICEFLNLVVNFAKDLIGYNFDL